MISGKVLDTPALIDLATGRTEYMRALVYVTALRGDTLAVPATVVTHAAAQLPEPARNELRWASDSASMVIVPLDAASAFDVAYHATYLDLDVVAGHVAHLATTRGWPIITTPDHANRWTSLGYDVDALP